ncbi:MAG TPA: hypothetical protein VGL81_11470 [Polyangiaceae bacterium]|jgi:hypothetical protein
MMLDSLRLLRSPVGHALGASLLLACSSAPPGETSASDDEALGLAPARFDVVSINDGTDAECPWNYRDSDGQPRCVSSAEWRALNYASPHFVVMGSDDHEADIEAAGNHLALYFNDLNDGWGKGQSGAAAADDAWSWANEHFSGSPPAWFVVNEVSRGGWEGESGDADGARYRAYVVAFVTRLANDRQRKVILCTPYVTPASGSAGSKAAAQAASWRSVAKVAVLAAEVQMTGAAVAADPGLPERSLGKTIAAYAALGIDTHERLMIVDNFSNTKPGGEYGRAGASVAQWETAIGARAKAFEALTGQLRGYLSYGWAGNEMGSTSATRVTFETHYAAQKLPNGE